MFFQTERLTIRELTAADVKFIYALLNSPDFKQHIGDRQIDNLDKALDEINIRYSKEYPNFGLFVIEHTASHQAVGGVTLMQRDYLTLPDLGYALLPQFYANGYAYEASRGLLKWAKAHNMPNLCAIVNPDNSGSIKLLKKLNFSENGQKVLPDTNETVLYFTYCA